MSYAGKPGGRRSERTVAFLFKQGGWQHCAGINSLILSADEQHLWTASRDSLIKRWDLSAAQPKLAADFEGHIDWVNSIVQIGPGTLVSASADNTLRVWDAYGTGHSQTCWPGHKDYVTSLATAPGTAVVASGGLKGELILWDVNVLNPTLVADPGAGQRPVGRWADGVAGSVYSLAMDAGGSTVAAGTADGSICLVDCRSGRCEVRLKGHSGNVRALQLSSDASVLLSGSSDHAIRLWDLRQQRSQQTFAVHTDSVWALAADPAFAEVLSGGRDGCVYRTQLATRTSELLLVAGAPVQALAVAERGSKVWAATTSSSLHCWRVDTPASATGGATSFVAGSLPALRSRMSFEGSGTCPRPQQKRPVASIRGTPPIREVAVLTDRRRVLTKDAEGRVQLWDVTTGAVVQELGWGLLKDAERSLFDPAHSVSPWFQPDTRLGCLAGYMEAGQCLSAETYQRDLGHPSAAPDAKVNMGEHMLKALFSDWARRRATVGATDLEEGGSDSDAEMHDAAANGTSIDDSTKAGAGLPVKNEPAGGSSSLGTAFQLRSQVPPVVMISGGSEFHPLRRSIHAFDGREREGEVVPQWVADCVLRTRYPQGKDLKMFFILQPAEGSGLPSMLQGRLSAPRVLGVDKVADYVLRKMADQGIVLREDPLFWAPEKQEEWNRDHGSSSRAAAMAADNGDAGSAASGGGGMLGLSIRQLRPMPSAPAAIDRPLLITCNGAAVPWDFTLAAARQWMWKKSEDLKLEYGVRQPGTELRPPVIRPPI